MPNVLGHRAVVPQPPGQLILEVSERSASDLAAAHAVAAVGVHAVAARAAVDRVAPAAHGVDDVVAVSAADDVAINAPVEPIVAGSAVESITSPATLEHVVAGTSFEPVRAAAAEEGVGAGPAVQQVTIRRALQVVSTAEPAYPPIAERPPAVAACVEEVAVLGADARRASRLSGVGAVDRVELRAASVARLQQRRVDASADELALADVAGVGEPPQHCFAVGNSRCSSRRRSSGVPSDSHDAKTTSSPGPQS